MKKPNLVKKKQLHLQNLFKIFHSYLTKDISNLPDEITLLEPIVEKNIRTVIKKVKRLTSNIQLKKRYLFLI